MKDSLKVLGRCFHTYLVIVLIAATCFFLLTHFIHLQKHLELNAERTVIVSTLGENGESFGTGVVFNNKDKCFVWTCAHCVANVIDSGVEFDIIKKTAKPYFTAEKVYVGVKLFNEKDEESGFCKVWANVIRYSAADDLAILEVRNNTIFKKSVDFPREIGYTPTVGSRLFHIGNMNGPAGFNSMVEGLHGQHGTILNGKVYDKAGLSVQHGSSGGGVFESVSGKCIGLAARILDEKTNHQTFFIPIRRMQTFADRLECTWALDNRVCVPQTYLDNITDDSLYIERQFLKGFGLKK